MDELVLIGIGTGSPDHLTREGEAEIRGADCILVPRKGAAKAELAELKKGICASVLGVRAESRILEFDMPVRASCPDYLESVDAWHGEIGKAWNAALEARVVQRVALLVWGDPSLYDSTLRIAARLRPAPQVRVGDRCGDADGELSFRHLDPTCRWGAYLASRRADCRNSGSSARHGWIMDTYLLKRRNRGVTRLVGELMRAHHWRSPQRDDRRACNSAQ